MSDDSPRYLPDHWTLTDALEFRDFVPPLADILLTSETPMTLGVHGAWGSGKTTLLQMLREEILTRDRDHVRTAWFTAWKYDRNEVIWRTLILSVIDSLYPKEDGRRLSAEEMTEDQQAQTEYLERLARSLYTDVDWSEKGGWAINVGEAVKMPIYFAARFAGLGDVAKEMGIDPKVTNLLRREITEYALEQVTSTEKFEETFEQAVRMILGERGRLVVFVDDLDRCLPEHAVSVLEAIKLFLNVPGTVFVLGMDREVVRRGIESHYGAVLSSIKGDSEYVPITGDQYLQKVVQLPFNIPPLDEDSVTRFVHSLEAVTPMIEGLDDLTRAVITRGTLRNPRQIKLNLNMFYLMKQIALASEARGGIPSGSISWPLLAKTVLVQTQWPELYRLWCRYPSIIQTLEYEYDSRRQPSASLSSVPGRGDSGQIRADAGYGVLEPYVSNSAKYGLLADLLTFPPYAAEGRRRARFVGLRHSEIRCYLGLTGETRSPQPGDSLRDVMDELLSGDVARIRESAAQVLEYGDARSQGIRESICTELLTVLRAASRPAAVRASAGMGLDLVGDPRFEEDAFYLPAQARLGFVEIPAGTFTMGSSPPRDADTTELEQPQSTPWVDSFLIQRYPVTRKQFSTFVERAGFEPADSLCLAGFGNHPVTNVTWYDALAYCEWLTEALRNWDGAPSEIHDRIVQGWRISLPSEAEWEKAARGADQRIYPWGDRFDSENANCAETRLGGPSTVGSFPGGSSAFGVEDLSGNVWEWTRSIYSVYPYPERTTDRVDLEDVGAGPDEYRVGRGGSYDRGRALIRCAIRVKDSPTSGFPYFGFRIILLNTRAPKGDQQ
jgi:formylglycine-generating enzyme required for sulfatase activity